MLFLRKYDIKLSFNGLKSLANLKNDVTITYHEVHCDEWTIDLQEDLQRYCFLVFIFDN